MVFHYHNSCSLLAAVLLLFLLARQVASEDSHTPPKIMTLHFSLYQQEVINQTTFIVTVGPAGAAFSQTTFPIGTIAVSHDNLTVSANSSSKVVGTAEGTFITSSLDGLWSIYNFKITLGLKNHKGSLSVMGAFHNTKPSTIPVVGGTEDFRFVQGYVTYFPIHILTSRIVYKIEFHLYWPPYAELLLSSK